jgi:hypothetical protein
MSKKVKEKREQKSGKVEAASDESMVQQAPESSGKEAGTMAFQQGDEGYEAWVDLGPVIASVVRRSDRLPSVDITLAIQEMRTAQKKLVQDRREEIRAAVGKDVRKMLDQALGRQDQVCDALLYADDKYQVESSDVVEASKAQIDAWYAEALSLQKIGFNWLPVLKSSGRISTEEAGRIEAGRGKKNTSSDVRILGEHFDRQWELLEPLQKAQKDESLRLTPENVKRMRYVGGKLSNALAGKLDEAEPEERIDWRDQVIVLYQLLEDDYHIIKASANFYYTIFHRFEDQELNTLRGFHISKASKSASKRSKRAKRSRDEKAAELPSPDETTPSEVSQPEETPEKGPE